MYLNRGHGPPQSLNIWREHFGPLTACVIHKMIRCRGYMDDFQILPSDKEICLHSNGTKLHKMQESIGSAVDDNHPAGCSPRGDRTTKN